jgi:hypothetical protein
LALFGSSQICDGQIYGSHRHTQPATAPGSKGRERHSPFDIQGLVYHSLLYDAYSSADLRACALVCRSWVAPRCMPLKAEPQARQFERISFTLLRSDNDRWFKLQDVIQSSLHLIPHIRHLTIATSFLLPQTLVKICGFPFTHLKSVRITSASSFSPLDHLQRLLRLPIWRVAMIPPQPTDFPEMLENCSPTIKGLILCSFSGDSIRHMHHHKCEPRARLEALQIVAFRDDVANWLTQGLYTFDISGLKALAIYGHTISVHSLTPAFHAVEILEIQFHVCILRGCSSTFEGPCHGRDRPLQFRKSHSPSSQIHLFI